MPQESGEASGPILPPHLSYKLTHGPPVGNKAEASGKGPGAAYACLLQTRLHTPGSTLTGKDLVR